MHEGQAREYCIGTSIFVDCHAPTTGGCIRLDLSSADIPAPHCFPLRRAAVMFIKFVLRDTEKRGAAGHRCEEVNVEVLLFKKSELRRDRRSNSSPPVEDGYCTCACSKMESQ